MRLRDRLEFSKEENAEFDFLEERFLGLEEIGFDCKNGNRIELLFELQHQSLIGKKVEELDSQKYISKEINISGDKIEVVLHLKKSLKTANRVTRFIVDVYDFISLKFRNISHRN